MWGPPPDPYFVLSRLQSGHPCAVYKVGSGLSPFPLPPLLTPQLRFGSWLSIISGENFLPLLLHDKVPSEMAKEPHCTRRLFVQRVYLGCYGNACACATVPSCPKDTLARLGALRSQHRQGLAPESSRNRLSDRTVRIQHEAATTPLADEGASTHCRHPGGRFWDGASSDYTRVYLGSRMRVILTPHQATDVMQRACASLCRFQHREKVS